MKISLTLNGRSVSVDVPPHTLLSEVLRDTLGLTGTHVGCDTSQCGACVVHVDGASVNTARVRRWRSSRAEGIGMNLIH